MGGMLLDEGELLGREFARLLQDHIADTDFSDIVQQRAYADFVPLLWRDMHRRGNGTGAFAYPAAMTAV